MIWATSIWKLGCSNRSKIHSAQKCYLCLRYVVSPMCPGRTQTGWRRRRDSNPRDPFGSNGFQDRRFQPLTHSSVSKYNLQQLLAGRLVTIVESSAAFWCVLSPKRSSFATDAFFESRFVCE